MSAMFYKEIKKTDIISIAIHTALFLAGGRPVGVVEQSCAENLLRSGGELSCLPFLVRVASQGDRHNGYRQLMGFAETGYDIRNYEKSSRYVQ